MACVTREALISALVGRAKKGERIARADLDALLRSGVPFEQLLAAFSGEGDGLASARTLLAEIGSR